MANRRRNRGASGGQTNGQRGGRRATGHRMQSAILVLARIRKAIPYSSASLLLSVSLAFFPFQSLQTVGKFGLWTLDFRIWSTSKCHAAPTVLPPLPASAVLSAGRCIILLQIGCLGGWIQDRDMSGFHVVRQTGPTESTGRQSLKLQTLTPFTPPPPPSVCAKHVFPLRRERIIISTNEYTSENDPNTLQRAEREERERG